MNQWTNTDNDRGVSEIYGTFLIISFVIIVAISVIGIGTLAFQNLGDEADDNLAEQSMLELDNKLSDIASEDIDSSETIEFPDGTGSNVNANPTHGNVTISVETHDDYWYAGDSPGNLFRDAPTQVNKTNITLGTIEYEDEDGQRFAFQGGAVWKKQGDQVILSSPPDITAKEDQLDLSFIDISSVSVIGEGEEVELKKDAEGSVDQSKAIMTVIEKQMRSQFPNGRYIGSANITINITSDFAQGWADYADANMNVVNTTVYPASSIPEDRDKVEIELGTYGEGLTNVPDAPKDFDDGVVYTGFSEYAYSLYNNGSGEPWNGNITDDDPDEFKVVAPNASVNPNLNYTTGILYNNDTRGEGPEWWAFNNTDGKWWNVEDPHAEPLESSAIPSDVVPGSPNPANDRFKINRTTWTCVVATDDRHNPDQFRDRNGNNYVPNATEYNNNPNDRGCLETPAGVNATTNWKDYVGNYKTDFVIESFTTKIEDSSGNPVHNSSGTPFLDNDTDALKPGYTVNLSVEWTNEGYRDANTSEVPVAFLSYDSVNKNDVNTLDPSSDPNVTYAERHGTDMGQTEQMNWSFPVLPNDVNYFFTVGTGTPHDIANITKPDTVWEVDVPTPTDFNVSFDDVRDNVVEGNGRVEVDLNITNYGTSNDTQSVFLWAPDVGNDTFSGGTKTYLNQTKVQVDKNDSRIVTLSWETEEDRGSDFGDANWTEIEATIPSSNKKEKEVIDVDQASTTSPTFEINSVEYEGSNLSFGDMAGTVEEGQEAAVIVEVENTGGQSGISVVNLERDGVGADEYERTNGTTVDLNPGDTERVALGWQTIPGDADTDPYTLIVETDGENFQFKLNVDPQSTGSNFTVDIEEYDSPVVAGEELWVNGTVTNYGDADTQDIILQGLGVQDTVDNMTLSTNQTKTFNLSWETDSDDAGTREASVFSDDDLERTNVEIQPRDDEAEFKIDITNTTDPITEGEPLVVDLNVTNNGTARGSTAVGLQNFADEYINVTNNDVTLNPGESETVTLTWFTLIGLVPDGDDFVEDDVTAEAGNATDTETVKVNELEGTRPPVDVAFVIDESGSMGSAGSWKLGGSELTEEEDVGSTGNRTVPDGEIWAVQANDCSIWCSVEFYDYYTGGEELDFDDYQSLYPGIDRWDIRKFTEPGGFPTWLNDSIQDLGTRTVPNNHMWMIKADCDGCQDINDGWYTAGQKIDFDDYSYGNSDYKNWRLVIREYPSSGQDENIERIPAVQAAIGALNKSKDRAAALQYDTSVEFTQNLTGDLTEFNNSLTVDAGGNTDISLGMEEAVDHLLSETSLSVGQPAEDRDRKQIVIVLTDGKHHQGSPDPTEQAEEYNWTYGSQPLDMELHTVGFGNPDDEELKDTANITGKGEGNYTRGEDPSNLAAIFRGIIREATEEQKPELDFVGSPSANDPVAEGEQINVTVDVESVGASEGRVPVTLFDWKDRPVDSQLVNLSTDLDPSGETTVTLTWDTDGVINGSTKSDDLAVRTSGEEESIEVEVQDKSADYQLTLDDVQDGVEEGEDVVFNVNVDNQKDVPDEQKLWVTYEDNSSNVTVTTSDPVSLDGLESTTDPVEIVWATDIGDSSINNVTIHSEQDTVTTGVDIKEAAAAEGEFEVNITSSDNTATVGDEVTVDVEIENVNGSAEPFPAEVELRADGTEVDSKIVSLTDGETTTETFGWWANQTGNITLTVEAKTTGANTIDDTTVDVTGISTGQASFEVLNVSTNADAPGSPISASDTLKLENLTVKNVGSQDGRKDLILYLADGPGTSNETEVTTIDTGTISANSTEDITIGRDINTSSIDSGSERVIVKSQIGNRAEQDITVTSSAGNANLNVSITNVDPNARDSSLAPEAGETVKIEFNINNSGATPATDLFVSLREKLDVPGSEFTLANFTEVYSISAGDTYSGEIIWHTGANGNDDDPWTVQLEVEGATDKVELWVDETDGQTPGGPGFGSGTGISVDIEDINVDS